MAPPGLRPSIIRAAHQGAAQRLKTTTIYVTHDQICQKITPEVRVLHNFGAGSLAEDHCDG
jgi:ABC-type sugar transport system ATPase subunit